MRVSNDCDQGIGIGELLFGGALKPDPGMENGCGGFGTGYAIPATISCPPAANKGKHSTGKKRKADQAQIPNLKVAEEECKSTVQNSTTTTTTSGSTITNSKNKKTPSGNNSKGSEVPKPDYIHVRARRGQATDSHSLAERVRREKISERMRYLQDLVPGCNRITGKAGMLDEIINYVQSLQRQVEFLSMKLASVNPAPDFDIDSYLAKEMFPACTSSVPAVGASPHIHMVNPASVQFSTLGHGVVDPSIEMGVNHSMDVALRRTISAPVSIPDAILDSPCLNQMQHLAWEDELQKLFGLAYQQERSTPFVSQPFTGLTKQAT